MSIDFFACFNSEAKTTYPVFFMSSSKAVKYSGTLIIPDSLEKIALSHFISSSRKLTSSLRVFLMELHWSFHFYIMTQADLAGFFQLLL